MLNLLHDLLKQILSKVQVDAALFSEPIGGNHGPLISPAMYLSIVLKSYQPIFDVLHSYGINTVIYRTYANTRALLPSVVKAGFNCLWACECNPQAMNYHEIRHEFGRDLRLIGGIDFRFLTTNSARYLSISDGVGTRAIGGWGLHSARGWKSARRCFIQKLRLLPRTARVYRWN